MNNPMPIDMMNSSDALIWNMEKDPILRSTVMTVWYLNRQPSAERVEATMQRMVAELPRMRRRVVSGSPRPRWVETDFNVADHYVTESLGPAATHDDVMAYAQRWVRQPFDRDRPLWHAAVLTDLADGRAAFVFKVHHAIADGMGLVMMLASLADFEPSPADRPVAPLVAEPESAPRSLGDIAHATGRALRRRPAATISGAVKMLTSASRLVMPNRTPLSPIMTERSGIMCLDHRSLSLSTMRAAGKVVDGSLNDAFVSVVLDALDRYHVANDTQADRFRVHVPINIRTIDAATASNQFVPARVVMRGTAANLRQRVRSTRDVLRNVRNEPALPHINTVSACVQRLGNTVSRHVIGGMMKGVDVLASNVPGPPCPMFLAGQLIEEFYAFGPPAGAAVNVTLFSYAGVVHLGITTDTGAIPDRELFLECIDEAIARVEALADATAHNGVSGSLTLID